ncbi:phosphatidylinositol glycan, class S [Cryptococcus bacillisporus CA1873]|uniref:Phosphatidylinositol glycan, class S n=1 Tax=Cryptococcus bacillisporus CA1873 TaxID=1296111 RepID=A0ABR5BCN6_CRYGA|nr:phosphatidylinositol glycan, class S [Cryptococcus bacillisporus CA1873]|eukprot:KIR64069.1 phosphatidylinositol glycan, class S [Cryptococcus gattii CA1873]
MSTDTPHPGPRPITKTPAEITASINPSPRRRLAIILSFPLLILLAVPFWWYTTSIERLPLPESRISALEDANYTAPRAHILFTADSSAFPTPPPGRRQFDTKDILRSLGKEVTKGVDGIFAKQKPSERDVRQWDLVYEGDKEAIGTTLRVHIRTWEYANSSFPLEPYVQLPETGLMTSGIPAGTLVLPVHPDQVGDRNLKLHYKIALINSILSVYPPRPPEIPLRALKYTPNITLSFVLLNEDATHGDYVHSWDIEGTIKNHFLPHLEALRPIFNFTIESQILYHAPLSFEPSYSEIPGGERDKALDATVDVVNSMPDHNQKVSMEAAVKVMEDERGNKAWMIDREQMKIFVNSEKWSLDSGSTNNPVLRFLLYVPSTRHRPMRLAVPDSAQAFLLPQFGGVVILNAPFASFQSHSYHLSCIALAPAFHLFTQHLYSLLALPSLPYTPNKLHLPPPPSPFHRPSSLMQPLSPWQVHQVLLARLEENFQEGKKTLKGIVRLVRKIGEMKVGEGVRDTVLGAVIRLEKVQQSANLTALQAFVLARDAVELANKAFFDPSMMGLLYFPDEHKFAVYTPLFAPIAVPLIIGLLRELLSRRKRGKAVEYTEKCQSGHVMLDEIQEGAVHGTATSQVDINEKEKTMESSGGSLSDNSPLRTIRSRVIHE